MTIVVADLQIFYSGGAANADGNASLGGVISSVEVSEVLHELYDLVVDADAEAGDVEYRCIYVKNNSAETLSSAVIYINTNTASPDTELQIGLGTSAINGTEQVIADEDTDPVGVTFSVANGQPNGLAIGDMVAGSTKAVWLKRIVDPYAGASLDVCDVVFTGVTTPS